MSYASTTATRVWEGRPTGSLYALSMSFAPQPCGGLPAAVVPVAVVCAGPPGSGAHRA